MELVVLASGSSGNCYLLQNKEECLVIEAGISFKKVKQAIDFKVDKIVGLLVSHEHGDHAKYVLDYIRSGIFILASKGTIEALALAGSQNVIYPEEVKSVGNFRIKQFHVQHDARDPTGFVIYHKEMGYLVFATDTYYVKEKFPNVNHILVECNYKQSILDNNLEKGLMQSTLRNRIMKSHFELENVKIFLNKNNSSDLKNVVLLHLSDRNSDEELFQKECNEITKKQTYIAEQGLSINLDLIPF